MHSGLCRRDVQLTWSRASRHHHHFHFCASDRVPSRHSFAPPLDASAELARSQDPRPEHRKSTSSQLTRVLPEWAKTSRSPLSSALKPPSLRQNNCVGIAQALELICASSRTLLQSRTKARRLRLVAASLTATIRETNLQTLCIHLAGKS